MPRQPTTPGSQQRPEQPTRLAHLRNKIQEGVPPYQAFIDSTREVQLDMSDTQIFRIDIIREIENLTGRRLIVYEASLTKGSEIGINTINADDKIGFCSLTDNLGTNEIDVLIHSPGGQANAVEQIVHILRERFENIRFIIPDAAKSAATMLVLSGDKLIMDERSELGPIDPQVAVVTPSGPIYVPAHTILQGLRKP